MADPDGLETFMNAIPDDVSYDGEEIVDIIDPSIRNSEEAANFRKREFIKRVYRCVLDREPDDEGMATYMGFDRYRDIFRNVWTSEEAQNHRG